jgi:hypothetical protein
LSDQKEAVMAKCFRCKKEMCDESTITCKGYNIVNFPDGKKMAPVPYTPNDSNIRCHDCNVAYGGFHHIGCDMETCPNCGGQFLGCSCFINTKDNDEVMTYTINSAVEEIYELGKDICFDTGDLSYAVFFFSPKGKYCEDKIIFTDEKKAMKFIKEMIAEYQAKIVVLMSKASLYKTIELPPGFSTDHKEIMHIYGEDENANFGVLLEYWRGNDDYIEFGKEFVFPEGKAIGQLTGFLNKNPI